MNGLLTLFLCGDVMLARGIDQILPDSVDPQLHEPFVRDAREYVELAERAGGPIPAPVGYDYVWGDALTVLEQARPAVRIINLENALTTSDEFWPGKGIHYRCHPRNVGVLKAAKIDVAVLANNHTLDWGRRGLDETLATLAAAGVAAPGAGADIDRAAAPAVIELGEDRRLLVFAAAVPSSGVPDEWAADAGRSGVHFLPRLDDPAADRLGDIIRRHARPNDLVVLSIHWGGNWGYDIPAEQVRFAHRLIDTAGVDVIHGHSSHHPRAIEVYRDRLILYGAGDFINDYEGIGGHEEFRPDLRLMYLPALEADGKLSALRVAPMRMRRMRLSRPDVADLRWVAESLDRQCRPFGLRFEPDDRGGLTAR